MILEDQTTRRMQRDLGSNFHQQIVLHVLGQRQKLFQRCKVLLIFEGSRYTHMLT
jgi:hypothetical protein